MRDSFGSAVNLTIFGESHGPAVGGVLHGLAAGLPVDEDFIARQMDKRRARGDGLTTARTEPDTVRFLSGVYKGHTTGTAITFVIENTNTRSGDYDQLAVMPRPGHADFTALAKYQGWQDSRGGGHFSGRLTAPVVAAGALCLGVLAAHGVRVGTHIIRCAGIEGSRFDAEPDRLARQLDALDARTEGLPVLDTAFEEPMRAAIKAAAADGDSVGGVLETAVLGLPAGIGEPFFDSVESVLSHLLFSIPAVKGVEFGSGFALAEMRGSQANDPFLLWEDRVVTGSNHNGGVNGGITNGMPLVLSTVIKPTPSIFKEQATVDLSTGQAATLQLKGRHDPCILPRARVVQDSMVALGLLDLMTQSAGLDWQRKGSEA